jgi:hypothetical protein
MSTKSASKDDGLATMFYGQNHICGCLLFITSFPDVAWYILVPGGYIGLIVLEDHFTELHHKMALAPCKLELLPSMRSAQKWTFPLFQGAETIPVKC